MKFPRFLIDPIAPSINLRKEIFLLGGRHQGDALAGALSELNDSDITPEKRQVLRAVVSHLSANNKAGASTATPANQNHPFNYTEAILFSMAIIMAFVVFWPA